MKKIKSPVDLEHSFADKKVVLKADKWAVFDDFHADEMKRIFPFIDIEPATEEDIKVAGESKKVESAKKEEKAENKKSARSKKSKK